MKNIHRSDLMLAIAVGALIRGLIDLHWGVENGRWFVAAVLIVGGLLRLALAPKSK